MINETLVRAAQYMDEHGKANGDFRDKEGRVCMIGAIRMVTFPFGHELMTNKNCHDEYLAAYQRLANYVKHLGLLTADSMSSFDGIDTVNDYIHKTKEESVKFMMEAAEWEPSK